MAISNHRKTRIIRMFNSLDTNGDGYFTLEDLHTPFLGFARASGMPEDSPQFQQMIQLSESFLDGFLKMADSDNDGRISQDELMTWAAALSDGTGASDHLAGWLDSFTNLMDLDQDGFVAQHEYATVQKMVGYDHDQLLRAWKHISNDVDPLPREEFMNRAYEYFADDSDHAPGHYLFPADDL